jgi:hypothetical protein
MYGIVLPNRLLLLLIVLSSLGCSKQPIAASNKNLLTHAKSPVVALAGTKPVRLDDILPALIEIGGKEVMEDYVLTLALEDELKNKNLSVTPKDIETEELLFKTMYSNLTEDKVQLVLRNKGLGTKRQRQLFWRNAALRKLVFDEVHLTDDATKRMFSIVHGVTYPTRIIVTSTQKEAGVVIDQLQSGTPFIDLAVQHSIDSSASRGGLVEPIPIADPLWPESIREALPNVSIGEFSNPIFIGDRWIIVKVIGEKMSSDVSFEEAKSEMEKLAKLAQERFLMEELATALRNKYSVTYFNPELKPHSGSDIN